MRPPGRPSLRRSINEVLRRQAALDAAHPAPPGRREAQRDPRAGLQSSTGPFAYVRLLGDREAVDVQAIGLRRRRVPVIAFVNNHYAGFAPGTVRQLATLVDPVASA